MFFFFFYNYYVKFFRRNTMRKINFLISLLVVGFLFSCAGVGGEALTEAEQDIAVRSLLGQTSFATTYVNSALDGAEDRAVIESETGIELDQNGSTLDYKASVTCGANVTVSVAMKAHFNDMKGDISLNIEGAEVACTSYLSGDMKLDFSTKAGLSGSEVTFKYANSNSKGLTLKVVRNDTQKVVFEKAVFFLFETSYGATTLGGSSAKVTCKINSQKFEADWINAWNFAY